MLHLRRAVRSHRLLSVVLLAAVAGVVLQGASLPHTHAAPGIGLYNQDHDRSLLATLHGAAALFAAQPAVPLLAVAMAVSAAGMAQLDPAAPAAASSRAPPLV